MVRPFQVAAALPVALMLALPQAARASTHTVHCAKARSSSFKQRHCAKGHVRVHKHAASHRLTFTAHDGRCPDANLRPDRYDIEQVRAATLCLVNRERTSRGERPLHWNNRLIRSAQAHTESMAFDDYFGHGGPGGQTPLSRMRRTGYVSSSRIGYEVGENIAWGSLRLGTPSAIVAAWMASPGHRANILDRRFRDTGVGVSAHIGALDHGQPGGIYTQDFGVIIS